MKNIYYCFAVCLALFLGLVNGKSDVNDDWEYSVSQEGRPSVSVITLLKYQGAAGHVDVPAEINGIPVRYLGNNQSSIDPSLLITSISIPDSVVAFKNFAFYGAFRLTSITFGNGLRSMGIAALGKTGLVDVTIPQSVEDVESHIFFDSQKLKNVVLDCEIPKISEAMFHDSPNLTNVTMPSSVVSIERFAFAKCTSLESATIPDGVKSIGEYAFSGCPNLLEVIIPDSVITIEQQAFKEGASIAKLILGKGVLEIGFAAFAFCDALQTVVFPPLVESVSGGLFYENTNLLSVVFGDSVTTIGDFALGDCPVLTSVLFKGDAPMLSGEEQDVFGFSSPTIYVLLGRAGWTNVFADLPVVLFQPQATVSSGVMSDAVFTFEWSGTGRIPMNVERSDSLTVAGSWFCVENNNTEASFSEKIQGEEQVFYRVSVP